MRNADELSTTTVPALTATGANFFDVPLPAENKPMSTPAKLPSVSSCTRRSLPRNFIVLPAERADANSLSSLSGNLRCSRHCKSSPPTAPVAPTMATTGLTIFFAGMLSSRTQKKTQRQKQKSPVGVRRGFGFRLRDTRSVRKRLQSPGSGFFGGGRAGRRIHGRDL